MITDNYIKMCEQAEKLQKSNINIGKRHFNNQDFVAYNCGEGLKVYVCSEISRYWLIEELIWLPTQEQLQEIYFNDNDLNFADIFNKFFWEFFYMDNCMETDYVEPLEKTKKFHSFVELWLAFVMHEKYHKIWTGEKWVKAND